MLHVTNGDVAADLIGAAGLEGDVLAWREALHEGPLPEGLDRDALRAVRARFFATCGWGDAAGIETALRDQEERLTAAARAGEGVVLWFEHDLFDQLQLVQILDTLEGAPGVEAVLTDRFLGHMDAAEVAALWPRRTTVHEGQVALAGHAWAAVRARDPRAIEALLSTGTDALPHLAAALRRLLEELPATGDGLSRTERQVLSALADGPRTPVELLDATARAEEAPFLGDTWLWRRITDLAGGERPLLRAVDGGPVGPAPARSDEGAFARRPLDLTGEGRAVLAGEADRAALVPLDRWVGGIHVAGDRPAWRWDRGAMRVVSDGGAGR